MKYILFYQDEAQLSKILAHTSYTYDYLVHYKKKFFISIKKNNFDGSYAKKSVWELFFRSLFKHCIIVCEFANFLPRVFALASLSQIESHVFGYMNKNTLKCVLTKSFVPDFFKKIYCNQYSSKYIIYG